MPRQLTDAQKLVNMNKRRAFAWAKYYELANEEHNRDYDHYQVIRSVVVRTELDEFVKKQLIEMGEELKKAWECPVCMEFIPKEQLDITPCGHYFCKGCLVRVKEQPTCECPVCRRKLGQRGDSDNSSG